MTISPDQQSHIVGRSPRERLQWRLQQILAIDDWLNVAQAPPTEQASLGGEQLLSRQGTQARELVAFQTKYSQNLPGLLADSLSIRSFIARWTLQNRSLKKAPGRGHSEKQCDASRARREAKGRDIVGVPPKGYDILTYPLEGRDLIEQAAIACRGIGFPRQFCQIEKTQHAQAAIAAPLIHFSLPRHN